MQGFAPGQARNECAFSMRLWLIFELFFCRQTAQWSDSSCDVHVVQFPLVPCRLAHCGCVPAQPDSRLEIETRRFRCGLSFEFRHFIPPPLLLPPPCRMASFSTDAQPSAEYTFELQNHNFSFSNTKKAVELLTKWYGEPKRPAPLPPLPRTAQFGTSSSLYRAPSLSLTRPLSCVNTSPLSCCFFLSGTFSPT